MSKINELKDLIKELNQLPEDIESESELNKYINCGKKLAEKVKEITPAIRENSLNWRNFNNEIKLTDNEVNKLFLIEYILHFVKFSNNHLEIAILTRKLVNENNRLDTLYTDFRKIYIDSKNTVNNRLITLKDTFEKANTEISNVIKLSSKQAINSLQLVKGEFNTILLKAEELSKLPVSLSFIEKFEKKSN